MYLISSFRIVRFISRRRALHVYLHRTDIILTRHSFGSYAIRLMEACMVEIELEDASIAEVEFT